MEPLAMLEGWVKAGWVNPATKDDGDFINGVSALSYVGHWVYADCKIALRDDLVLIPMPRFGTKAVTGAGSWNFGISAESKTEILQVTEVNEGGNAGCQATRKLSAPG